MKRKRLWLDTVPEDNGAPCRTCPHGEYCHRPLNGKRRDCLYCRCAAFTEKGLL